MNASTMNAALLRRAGSLLSWRNSKWAVMGLGGLVLAGMLAVLLTAAVWLRRPFPKQSGEQPLPGLKTPVDVYRDALGVAHVYATTRADLLFSQGYVHAQDRFWQMELARRAAAGRLSEVVGAAAIESDRYSRTVGYNRIARDLLENYQSEYPQVIQDLNDYARGVNAYLTERGGSIDFSHTVVSLQNPWPLEPWSAYDTVIFGVFMAAMFETSWNNDYSNTLVYAATEPAKRDSLLPLYRKDRPVVVGSGRQASNLGSPGDAVDRRILPLLEREDGQTSSTAGLDTSLRPGSNSWVVSGKYTASGKPILANDPHLLATLPMNFYQMGLHGPGVEVVGFSLPGGPGIIIGRNRHISWGLTNAVIDTQDAYLERLNPADRLEYEVNGRWERLTTVREVIKVANAPDVIVDVRSTRHGPIVRALEKDSSYVIALQWQGQRKKSRLFKAIWDLNQASNYTAFREALRYWEAPALNFVYADDTGNIAYQLVANVPKRRASRFLVPGFSDEHEWNGWFAYEDLPASLNPDEGYLVTANNAITAELFPAQFITDPGDRSQRITQLLQQQIRANQKISSETMAAMQLDRRSELAATYTPLIVRACEGDPKLEPVLARLKTWDFRLEADQPEAGFFSIFLAKLSEATFSDELRDRYGAHATDHELAVLLAMELLAAEPDDAWWDDVGTTARETRDAIVRRAAESARRWLVEHAGPSLDDWQWGKLHTVLFRALPLGISGVKPLEWLVNRGPYPVGGDVTTINVNSWVFDNVAETLYYPTLRFVCDMSDVNGARALGSIGQSGHPTHPNYDDMIPFWRSGRLRPMPFDARGAKDQKLLTLLPRQ